MKKVPAWVQINFLVQGYKGLTKLPSRRVISSPEEEYKKTVGYMLAKGKNYHANI
jgi:hypothetical protein